MHRRLRRLWCINANGLKFVPLALAELPDYCFKLIAVWVTSSKVVTDLAFA